VFLSIPRNTAMRVGAKAIELVRDLYPVVVLKTPGPIRTRVTQRPR